ncbi:hypothetical protein [Streptosporangium carneum]|uniref:Uncharacterized protein n=1 Tax=Streptosporangium carneum TaxID=47481 RepID=A0A9W6MFY3_9ACTN|nr:hypothetical protein [Streptosporangium carneum]GLK12535.1 hypothetical protein GCM10017600_59450 [Streptosporangium carneum]
MPIAFKYADDAERQHAEKLAAARQQLAHEKGLLPTWEELTDEEREQSTVEAAGWLRAGRRAGLYDFDGAPPVTAVVRDTSGKPIPREHYEAFLRDWIEKNGTGERLAMLDRAELSVVTALLNELCGVYPKERLGQIVREMAVELNDRGGV